MHETWSNWSGLLTASPAEIIRVSDEGAVCEAVRQAGRSGRRVRCVGAAHSHSKLVATEGTLLDPAGLAGVVSASPELGEAVVGAGSRIADLGLPLREHGVALHNQGDIDRQAIAGAVATGTHGTGSTLRNLSASVLGVRLVLASGDVVECSEDELPELFEVARLSLGAVGVATELRLRDQK